MSFTLSSEQSDIIIGFKELLVSKIIKSIGIKAFAGCGKSFILKYMANEFSTKRFLGLAFNSSIVKENRAEFPKKNCKWFTLHGLAKEYLLKEDLSFSLKASRSEYKPLELFDLLDIKDKSLYSMVVSVSQCFKVYCQSDKKEFSGKAILDAADKQMNDQVLDIPKRSLNYIVSKAQKLWELMEAGEIAPTFDFYLKYFEVKGFAKKIKDFDVVMLDEAQDSNSVTMSIIYQIPAKYVFVGDPHQSIYGFRGSVNALDYVDKLYYLSYTYRYIPKIADFATSILREYKLEKKPIKSHAKEGKIVTKAFLSRNNSSMISLIDEFVTKKIKFKTVKDPKELFSLAIAILELRINGVLPDGFDYLKQFKDIEEIEDYIEETSDREIVTAFKMQRRYGKKLYMLKKVAVSYYKKKDKDIVYFLSTAHTSKGLEWDSVELLRDFPDMQNLMKSSKIKTPHELMKRFNAGDYIAYNIIQEINLWYVAVTRAKYLVE